METISVNAQLPVSDRTVPGSSSKVKGNLATAFVVCFVSIMFSGFASMLMSVYLPVACPEESKGQRRGEVKY
jgi:hypothetical protein